MSDDQILPCPWCGEYPDINNPASFRTDDGGKWGWLEHCAPGPEVRAGYKPLETWRHLAIEAWNDRPAPASVPDEVPASQLLSELYKIIIEYWSIVGPDEHYSTAKRALFDLDAMLRRNPLAVPTDELRIVMEFVNGYVGEWRAPHDVEFASYVVDAWLTTLRRRPTQEE